MSGPVAFVATQALLVWFIVIFSIVPIPKPKTKYGIAIVVTTTTIAVIDIVYFYGEWIILIAAIAGYGWGTILHNHTEKMLAKRKSRILNGE